MTASALNSILSTGTSCNGTLTKVQTTQTTGESLAAFSQRHLDAVAAKRAECNGTFKADPSTYTTPVDCNGAVTDVLTTQGASQAWADFLAQHNDAVRNAISECP